MGRIRKILIANRGEIAVRVMRTCRSMGIGTVAVFSDADRQSLHVSLADEAVRIGPPPSVDSYLDQDAILRAARLTQSDAIHPGYGFLSENAAFAQAVQDAGLTFIGPPPDVIRAMGSKRESKALVAAAGVAVIPGYDGEDQDPGVLAKEAKKIGFPVLIKASAGGGGRGMRVVRGAKGLIDAIESARRESESAFGDGTLLIERYIERPRHVEIQILGDQDGNIVHLFERECSVQRRHQKVIEETPSVAVSDALREEMGEAAVTIAKAIGYENAGTVEFILDPAGGFFFLEVNTRLQVEHPVTEAVTGIDLVRAQILVAQGEQLGFSQQDLHMSGASLECRIYAEDPSHDFLPCSGTILDWFFVDDVPVRVDGAVESGTEVSVFYDPLLAKLITHGATRSAAIDQMTSALRSLSVQGIQTNRDFLLRILEHPEYREGNIDTHFIDTNATDLAPEVDERLVERAWVGAALATHLRRRNSRTILPHLISGYRNNRSMDQLCQFEVDGRSGRVEYRDQGRDRYALRINGAEWASARVLRFEDPAIDWEDSDGVLHKQRVVSSGERHFVYSKAGVVQVIEIPRFPEMVGVEDDGDLVAPMPGTVVALSVSDGDAVQSGQEMVVLEAMKMEHRVCSPRDGTVEAVLVALGAMVESKQVLVVLADD